MRSSVAVAAPSTLLNRLDETTSTPLNCVEDRLTDAILTALARSGISNKEAAILQGIDPAQWSRQLHGPEHPSLRRMLKLGPVFWQEFVPALAQLCDAPYGTDPRWTLVLELVRAVFAGISPLPARPKMAKADLPAVAKKAAR